MKLFPSVVSLAVLWCGRAEQEHEQNELHGQEGRKGAGHAQGDAQEAHEQEQAIGQESKTGACSTSTTGAWSMY